MGEILFRVLEVRDVRAAFPEVRGGAPRRRAREVEGAQAASVAIAIAMAGSEMRRSSRSSQGSSKSHLRRQKSG